MIVVDGSTGAIIELCARSRRREATDDDEKKKRDDKKERRSLLPSKNPRRQRTVPIAGATIYKRFLESREFVRDVIAAA